MGDVTNYVWVFGKAKQEKTEKNADNAKYVDDLQFT